MVLTQLRTVLRGWGVVLTVRPGHPALWGGDPRGVRSGAPLPPPWVVLHLLVRDLQIVPGGLVGITRPAGCREARGPETGFLVGSLHGALFLPAPRAAGSPCASRSPGVSPKPRQCTSSLGHYVRCDMGGVLSRYSLPRITGSPATHLSGAVCLPAAFAFVFRARGRPDMHARV